MKTVNMHEAKTQLPRLVEQAAKGEAFTIARAGKAPVRATSSRCAPARNLPGGWELDLWGRYLSPLPDVGGDRYFDLDVRVG